MSRYPPRPVFLTVHSDHAPENSCFQAYLYYCSHCMEGLLITGEQTNLRRVSARFTRRCPHCHKDLKTTLKEELINTPSEIRSLPNPSHNLPAENPLRDPAVFITASQYRTLQQRDGGMLTFGDTELDETVQGLGLGSLAVLCGSAECLRLAEILCVRAQFPASRGGLGSGVLFLDGGNCFDPYLISDYARQNGLDHHVLERIRVSRAFTHPQLTTLVTQKLPEAVDRYKIKLVVISDISRLYRDAPASVSDVRKIFGKMILFLSILAQKKRILILATHHSSSGGGILGETLFHHAQIVVRVNDQPLKTVMLERHPYLKPQVVTLRRADATRPLIHFL